MALGKINGVGAGAGGDKSHKAVSVLFGPQGPVTAASLLEIRQLMRDHVDLHFLSKAIEELPALWPDIVRAYPDLARLSPAAAPKLDELARFFNSSSSDNNNNNNSAPDLLLLSPGLPANNVLLCPLTVVAQVVDFWSLTRDNEESLSESPLRDVQGLCLGFLTAAAVSCSRSEAQYQTLAANAVRLALCLGAVVDLDALGSECGASATLAARWKSPAQLQHLHDTIERHLGSYISVVTGPKTVTVTVPEHASAAFLSDLAGSGVLALPLAPRGRWHHRDHARGLEAMAALCERDERFRLPDASTLNNTLLSSVDGQIVSAGSLHEMALRSILTDQARWDLVFEASARAMRAQNIEFRYVSVGDKVTIPPLASASTTTTTTGSTTPSGSEGGDNYDDIPEDAVAIIGMACRYPDADSLDDFWDLIEAGRCVVREFPESRFKPSELLREPKGPYWGGYLRESDMFDHRFFGLSGREAKSMDPQQRVSLQVAYEAMESAGYSGLRKDAFDREVGCYVGVANDDYDCNVASHPINAFSLTGTLRHFISGRISHFFGWSGPSITIDTACSASAVAIHTACRALQAGDCSVALAGGVCAITSSRMTQNLIGATFLSPTGKSKAFDVDADGYCRAEGAGMVVLRPLREALRHGNAVLGIITGSAVNQGSNTSSIQVPDCISQLALYKKALAAAGTDPVDVSYVEAHGTGTQVGDPVEFKSIRETFGGPRRSDDVYVGSVKDNIGHTEASSGVASLVKTLLMFQKQKIPRQANFRTLNPKIAPLGPDRVLVPLETRAWQKGPSASSKSRIALINNYGAGGNNAAMVVREGSIPLEPNLGGIKEWSHFPVFVSGKTPEAVRAYCDKLRASSLDENDPRNLADVAYNLAAKQNRDFEHSLVLVSSSVADLSRQLELQAAAAPLQEVPLRKHKGPLPVVLCFGGQDGLMAHVSRQLYEGSVVLRRHLAACDAVVREELGLPSLFPAVLDPAPYAEGDVVGLNAALFAVQYACARTWLDCGLQVDRMVGHSFGQLTALCVSGGLSLSEALWLVVARARLLETHCESDKAGVMLVVEGSASDVDRLLEAVAPHGSVDVACYNGPRSFVLAGDDTSISAVEQAAVTSLAECGFRMKRLANSHAFHSRLLDPIVPCLRQAAGGLSFQPHAIPIEACIADGDDQDWSGVVTADHIARHTRNPVYFADAVRRIEQRYDGQPIVWLEAGSGSPVIPMLKRAIQHAGQHAYVPTPLRSDADAQAQLAKAVGGLWSHGVAVQFWPFHDDQRSEYKWLNLPPYQFAKVRHWLEYNPATPVWQAHATSNTLPTQIEDDVSKDLVRRLSITSDKGESLFEINPRHELYQLSTSGHEVVEQSLCPASLYIEFVLMASRMLADDETLAVPSVGDLTMSSPLVLNPVGRVFLKLTEKERGADGRAWSFAISTHTADSSETHHGSGRVGLSSVDIPAAIGNLQSLAGLMLQRCRDIEDSSASEGFRGPTVYQAMRRVVTYVDYFHGIRSYYTQGNEAVARISLPPARPKDMGVGFCDPVLTDSFTQAGGVLANCFCIGDDGDMWICNYIGDITYTRRFVDTGRREGQTWATYAKYERPSPKTLRCDIFVLDPDSNQLVLTIMAISFQKTSIRSLTKVLGKLNSRKTGALPPPVPAQTRTETPAAWAPQQQHLAQQQQVEAKTDDTTLQKVKEMLAEVIEIPAQNISADATLEGLGIDSLLATELFTEIGKRFKVAVSHHDFASVADVRGLAQLLSRLSVPVPSTVTTSSSSPRQSAPAPSKSGFDIDTVTYAERDGLALSADIYYPPAGNTTQKPLPIALMIHGGGHVISTRRDIRDDQTRILLDSGFLPVSVDYRLCPEVTLTEGAMVDVRDALAWARDVLPDLDVMRARKVHADGNRVVAVGWSSGAHLAMTLGWTSPRPPQAVLAFYGASDYEDPFWARPNLPFGHPPLPFDEASQEGSYDHLYDGLLDRPAVGYSPDPSLRALGGWMSLDDARSRVILHMNWQGKHLPVLLNGLRRVPGPASNLKRVTNPPAPSPQQIRDVSPLAHVRAGRYTTPTFFVHGTADDLVPWQASRRTHLALVERGVPARLALLQDAVHLFDIYPSSKRNPESVRAVRDGYDFLRAHV
ncbi:hypothetical protein C8A00DRAFT_13874 [Chaetomidium leptoderma]|uniref:Polyketide synthase n=1 Tax=Chaetomidium leptoderma TaxID=669021 RepID=A0AAN6VNW0_9PEZI|nr:hypothetical protein C8A00DRAFT_13874 [Chaetomidium leptoderma]